MTTQSEGVDLCWIPLGAGASPIVRLSGRLFEAVSAFIRRRSPQALYHSALIVSVADGSYVIEMTPVADGRGAIDRGVVAEGPVGARFAGRLRVFRYEIRRWMGGTIPDLADAVASPVRVSPLTDGDPLVAQRVLDLVPLVPTPSWGRDELGTGDMWNSNSLVAWLLVSAGLDANSVRPPTGGRAPGWDAGVVVAKRANLEQRLNARARRSIDARDTPRRTRVSPR